MQTNCDALQRPPPEIDMKLVSQQIQWLQQAVFSIGTESTPQKWQCTPGIFFASILLYVIKK